MENENGFSIRTSIRAWWVAAALGCLSLTAHAQSDFGAKVWWKSDHNRLATEVKRATGATGTPVQPQTGAATVNGSKVENAASQLPKVKSKAPGPTASTRGAVFDVEARVVPSSAAAALGRFASKVITPLAVGIAIYDLGQELGFGLNNSSGTLQVTTPSPGYCPTGPCYEWSPGTATFYRTPQAAANGFIGTFQGGCGTVSSVTSVFTTGGGHPSYAANLLCVGQGSPLGPFGLTTRTRAADTVPQTVPSTLSAFESAIAAKTGYPTSSAISRAITEAIKSGEIVDWDQVTVSGPVSSPGPGKVTTKPDGTVVTEATTNKYTYNTNIVTVTSTTTTSTFNPSTGNTTTETTEEQKPEEKDECETKPDSLGCAELDTPTDKVKKETEVIDYTEENVFGSGSCPANLTANVATLGSTVTVWDWQKTCDLAFPLRALVLGLATFAALLIVMPGSPKT